MEKRYQVFVSSTYEDLQEERQEVMQALLELDCIPSGMELFPAADESQWSVIQSVIDDCDYYVLILAGRYGSLDAEGMGYTEKEYRYAREIGKPTIAFLHKTPGEISANKTEPTEQGKEKLAAFRSFAEEKLCKYWSGTGELGGVVSRSLTQLMKKAPAVGWVRADELPDRDATLELLRLRRRVEELDSELARARTTAPRGTEDLAQGEDLCTLRYRYTLSKRVQVSSEGALSGVDHLLSLMDDGYRYVSRSCHGALRATWNAVFGSVAPLMINELLEYEFRKALDSFVREQTLHELAEIAAQEDMALGDVTPDADDFQTVKVQLRALGLIAKSEKTRSVKDTDTYWTLTPYGDDVMTRLRAIRRSPISREDTADGDE